MKDLDPELQRKLDEAERDTPPDYPDWKRGIHCGIAILIFNLTVSVSIAMVSRFKLRYGIPASLIVALAVAIIAAFRPQK